MVLFLFFTAIWYFAVYIATTALLDAYASTKPNNTNWMATGVSIVIILLFGAPILAYSYLYII